MILMITASVIVGYLIGSLNYSIIYSRLIMHSDVRSGGSGNAGSTNMMRSFGWKAGVLTLFTDFFKAFIVTGAVILLFNKYYPEWSQAAVALTGLSCCLGHCFPIFFKFKGGKGVAVGAIASLMVDWRCFLIIVATFLLFTAISKYVSLGSVTGAAAFPCSLVFFTDFSSALSVFTFCISVAVAALIIFLHRKNIARIFSGTERKLSLKK